MSLSMFATSKSESSLELLSEDEVSPESPLEDVVELLEDVSVEELLELEEVVLVLELLLELLELDPDVDDCVVDCCCWTTGVDELPPPPPPHADTIVLAINAKSKFLVKESI